MHHLLITHSILRWIVFITLSIFIYKCWKAMKSNSDLSKSDSILKNIMIGFFHLQIIVGFGLYFMSPLVKHFWNNPGEGLQDIQITFFALVHVTCMNIAAVLITLGSALAKRAEIETDRPKILLKYIGITLILVICAIPWPFLPWASRPWFRFG